MSGKFRFISLTDSSLLIEDTSDTAIEIDSAFGLNLSFLDIRITHEQLMRFFLLDNVFQEDFFSRIAHYHRKFFEEIPAEDAVKLAVALATEFEELFLEDSDFEYFHLMRRLPQDNVLFTESVIAPRIKTENELLFTAERVSKRLPDLLARHATQDEKSDFDFIVEFFDEKLDLLLLQNRLPKEITELVEVFNIYRFQSPREKVFTDEVVTRARGIVAKHETQLVDPFGDGSVPQKPGLEHIVEFLDERIKIARIKGSIQEGSKAIETFLIARKVDPTDTTFTAVQELLKVNKNINMDSAIPSRDIAYVQTKRDTVNRLLNYVKFTHIVKTVKEITELNDNVLNSAIARISRDQVYNEDNSKWLWKHSAKHDTNTSGKTGFDFVVEANATRDPATPGNNFVSFFSNKNFSDDIGELNETLLNVSNSSFLSDKFYSKEDSAWKWSHIAKHDTNTSGKTGFDFVVEANATRDPATPGNNFVSFFSVKGFHDDIGETKDSFLNISKSKILRDLINTEAKPSKFFKNYHSILTVLPSGKVTEGRLGHTDDDVYEEDDTVLKPGLGKKEKVSSQDQSLVALSTPSIRELVDFEDLKRHVLEINKTVPVEFVTDFQYSGGEARAPGTPKIKHRPSENSPIVDPYYVKKWQETYRHLVDPTTGNKKYPTFSSLAVPSFLIDGINTFTLPHPQDSRIIFQPDSKHREDYALVDDGHGSLSGDFSSLVGAEYKVLKPVWGGGSIGWWTTTRNYYPTRTAEGRRILFRRDMTAEDIKRAQVLTYSYNSEGQITGSYYVPLTIQTTGKSIFEKLRDLGRLGGTFFRSLGVEYLFSSSLAVETVSNIAGTIPTVATDRISATFYPFGQNPLGEPEDVKLRKSLGTRKDFVQIGGIDLNGDSLERIGKFFKNYHTVSVYREEFADSVEGKVGGVESNNATPRSRFHVGGFAPRAVYFERLSLRSRRYAASGDSDVIINSNVQPPNEDAWTDEKTSKNISNSIKNNLYYFGKIRQGIDGFPNEEAHSRDKVIAAAKNKIQESRAFIRQELFGIKEFVEIREEDPDALQIISKFYPNSQNLINLNTEAPYNRGTIRRWNDKLYVSYSRLTTREIGQTYSYTGFNTWEVTNRIYSWQRSGYGPTIQNTGTKYDREYTYNKGYAWNGYSIAPTFDDTPYYVHVPNGGANAYGFFWHSAQNQWIFIDGIRTYYFYGNRIQKGSNGNFSIDSANFLFEPLIASDPERPTGAHTIPDIENGGLINFTIYYPPYTTPSGLVTEYLWQNLGEINQIIAGNVQYPYVNPETGFTVNVSNPAGKLLFANNGHVYIALYNVSGLGPYSTTASLNSQNYGTPPGGIWRQVSYRTFEDLQPAPGEVISPVGVQAKNTLTDNSFYKRIMNYRRTHTETVEVADPGSAYIPVYCASYFLEPYVSEAGKNANF